MSNEAYALARELVTITNVVAKIKIMVTANATPVIESARLSMDIFNGVLDAQVPALVEALLPAYVSEYTLDELRGLLAFHKSALGQRLIAASPAVAKECIALAAPWGVRFEQALEEAFVDDLEEDKTDE